MADGLTLSYTQLAERADQAARRLAALGVGMGYRVAVLLPPGVEFAAVLHALPLLGAVLVPVNTRLSADERAWVIEDAGARVVVEEPLDGDGDERVALRSALDPEEPHCVIYTSGTTSRPKPVVLTYANHVASARASAERLGVRDDDAWLGVLPLFHVGGLQVLLRSAIYGTAAVIEPGFDAERVKSLLESGAVTLASFVPTMVRRLRDAGWTSAPRLRAALIGGGPVPGDLLEWAAERGLPLLQTYGMTETASQVVTASGPDARARALPGVELWTTPEGELLVRGPMVSRGALSDDGWLHTGDRGWVDADGFVHVEGRIGDTIITGGENVAAPEVEAALLSHPAVRDAGVVGRPDPEWGQIVVAYVVADGVSDDELLTHARARLAGYKLPKAIHRLDELPRSAGGKLLRRQLD